MIDLTTLIKLIRHPKVDDYLEEKMRLLNLQVQKKAKLRDSILEIFCLTENEVYSKYGPNSKYHVIMLHIGVYHDKYFIDIDEKTIIEAFKKIQKDYEKIKNEIREIKSMLEK